MAEGLFPFFIPGLTSRLTTCDKCLIFYSLWRKSSVVGGRLAPIRSAGLWPELGVRNYFKRKAFVT